MEKLLTPSEASKILGVSIHTLKAWRQEGQGPAWVAIGKGRKIRYQVEDLQTYINEKREAIE